MITIEITEKVHTHHDVVLLLEEIQRLINEGFTSGYYPHWELKGDEEVEDNNI